MRYAVIYERSSTGYGAYAPDLPGLGVVSTTLEETKILMREGIEAHVSMLRELGQAVPEPTSFIEEIDVRISA